MSDQNNSGYEEICSICRRPESVAGKLVRMPMNMYICPQCMDKMSDMIDAQMGGMNGAGAIDWSKVMNMYNPANFQMDPNMFQQSMSNEETEQEKKEADPAEGEKDLKKTEDPEKKEEGKEESKKPGNGIPKVSFVNLADLPFDFGFGGRQKVKKKEKGEHKPLIELKDIPAPHKIKAMLDEYVVGQEKAKKIMSVAVYNHYKRIATNTMDEIEIEKSNMLMLGPTGCGKTYLVQTLARILNVPLAITDATSLTEAGYIGDDIESVVSKLLAAAGNDVDKAEQGIIYIDEIDKIAKKQNTNSRDVSGESVQQGMLKLLEGADIEVPIGASSKNAMVPTTTVNTRNILFICGGAFPGIEEIIKNRLNKNGGIGFHAELSDKNDQSKKIMQKVETEDIRKFGMIPEFVGRLPMICTLEGLDQEMMVRILKEPKNAILKQYQKLLELDEVKLLFADDALELIAEKAIKKETGARALRSILDEYMVDIMYEIPKDSSIGEVIITKEYIEGNGGPRILLRGQ